MKDFDSHWKAAGTQDKKNNSSHPIPFKIPLIIKHPSFVPSPNAELSNRTKSNGKQNLKKIIEEPEKPKPQTNYPNEVMLFSNREYMNHETPCCCNSRINDDVIDLRFKFHLLSTPQVVIIPDLWTGNMLKENLVKWIKIITGGI